jgi:hypothetical protein
VKLVAKLSLAAFFGFAFPQGASASDAECYDAKVRAKPLAQIPSVYPRSDDPDVIVMSWPWFLDLRIKRVVDGEVPRPEITALIILHTSMVAKTRTFLLRRNTLGGFNVIRAFEPDLVKRCPPDSAAVEPYLRPGPTQTLDDLRREGEAEYLRFEAMN